ncbi:MAG: ATP-binding cassette domain-containing protein, partial [Eubacteriales bacterium]|nr:ATP-binding cassette domain-containing protein [Eubacteriales bacterium]
MSILDVKNLTVRYGEKAIVDNVRFSLNDGDWLMIVGPNGAGKSTIVNAVSQSAPYTGEISLLGKDIRRYRPQELAKRLGVLAQTHTMGYGF